MTEKDIQALAQTYSKVLPQEELLWEATSMLPAIIKVTEVYEGGPHPGKVNIEYKIITRIGNRVKAVASSNPDLTCTIDVDGGDVTVDDGAYHTSAHFKWDDHRKAYADLEVMQAPVEAPIEAV